MTWKSERDYICIPKVSFLTNRPLSLEEMLNKPLESVAVQLARADTSD